MVASAFLCLGELFLAILLMCFVIHTLVVVPRVSLTFIGHCMCSLECQEIDTGTTVHQGKYWIDDHYELLYVLEPTDICRALKSTPTYAERDDFLVSHPYNCKWYIRCYLNKGFFGASQECARPAVFNPNYTSTRMDYCLYQGKLPNCTETCPGENDQMCP